MNSKLHILLIEDSETDSLIIRRVLSQHMTRPYAVTHVCSLADAETVLSGKDSVVDVVLTDMGLPDAAGPEDIYRLVQSIKEDIPVLILTSHEDRRLAVSMIGSCAEDFIPKSVLAGTPEILCNAIEFAMYRRKNYIEAKNLKNWELKEKDRLIQWASGG